MIAHTDVDILTHSRLPSCPNRSGASMARRVLRLKSLTFLSVGFTALALTACSGGGSGDSPVSPDPGDTVAPGGGNVPGGGDVAFPPADDADNQTDLPGSPDTGDTVNPPVVDIPDPGAVDLPPVDDPDSGAIEPLPPGIGGFELPAAFPIGEPLLGSNLTVETFPRGQIVSGGVPKDGIPALTNPSFVRASEVSYLGPNDLVLGVVINGEARAYPHNIGWWHEIVNDVVGGTPICATLCPLTGTGILFDTADENGDSFELGVSGLLWNNNLIMYDRRDGSTLYPQIFSTAVDGPRQGETLPLLPVMETNWSTWVRLHPDTRVIASGTYSLNQYSRYPYGNYRTNDAFLIFGLNPRQSVNPNFYASNFGAKDMVLGVRLAGDARAYPFQNMGEQAAINDALGGVDIVVVWDRDSNVVVPFAREIDGESLTFDVDPDGPWPMGLRDRETGSLWNVEGVAVEGPKRGQRLTQVPAYNAFWFAWVTFWQDTDVWQG